MPALLENFLDPTNPSLKICGVRTTEDATRLADLGVDALGVNFWEQSKRYCPAEEAEKFLPALKGRILRVGVFVNAEPALPRELLERDLLDLVQFHGDETIDYCRAFDLDGLPSIKAVGVAGSQDLEIASTYPARGLLLDAHAPGVYGGTGQTIDWDLIAGYVASHPVIPVILAGGITPENAADALAAVQPAALDIASGAESAPGVKDFAKVRALLKAVRAAQ